MCVGVLTSLFRAAKAAGLKRFYVCVCVGMRNGGRLAGARAAST